MNFHLENQIVEITVPFKDLNGAAITPTAMTAVLMDGEESEIVDFGDVVFNAAEVETKIVIPGAMNTLQGDDLQEVRRLEVKITHAGGTFTVSHSYVIEAEQSLQIMRNSFMTYDTALMNSTQFVNMTAFASASDERRRAALVEAFRKITDLSMIYSIQDVDGDVVEERKLNRSNWSMVDADVFKTQFPTHFKRALRSAQLAEADDLLQGNVIAKKHAQGIASETIGESSVTLRHGFSSASSAGLGSTALALLSGYIDRQMKIARV